MKFNLAWIVAIFYWNWELEWHCHECFQCGVAKKYFNKFRHVDCNYLIQNKQTCGKCSNFTNSFRSTTSRYHKTVEEPEFKKQRVSVSSTTNLRYITREELVSRLNNAQNHKREALKKINKLSKIVAASIKQEGQL